MYDPMTDILKGQDELSHATITLLCAQNGWGKRLPTNASRKIMAARELVFTAIEALNNLHRELENET